MSRAKYPLDIFPYENILFSHASRNHDLRRLQRRRRTSPPRDIELSRAAGTACRRYRFVPGFGAAFGIEASPRPERRRPRQRAPRWPPYALSNERRGNSPASRMGRNLRAFVAQSVGTCEGTRGERNEKVSRI